MHDLHTKGALNWNQQQIRLAKNNPTDGFYTIEVMTAGGYDFIMSRYPPESQLAFNASAAPEPTTPSNNGFVKGKVLNIKEVIIEYEGVNQTGKVNPAATSASVRVKLPKGKGKLKTWFLLENGTKMPAYYTLVKKV